MIKIAYKILIMTMLSNQLGLLLARQVCSFISRPVMGKNKLSKKIMADCYK
jgi:hypothetical protein